MPEAVPESEFAEGGAGVGGFDLFGEGGIVGGGGDAVEFGGESVDGLFEVGAGVGVDPGGVIGFGGGWEFGEVSADFAVADGTGGDGCDECWVLSAGLLEGLEVVGGGWVGDGGVELGGGEVEFFGELAVEVEFLVAGVDGEFVPEGAGLVGVGEFGGGEEGADVAVEVEPVLGDPAGEELAWEGAVADAGDEGVGEGGVEIGGVFVAETCGDVLGEMGHDWSSSGRRARMAT